MVEARPNPPSVGFLSVFLLLPLSSPCIFVCFFLLYYKLSIYKTEALCWWEHRAQLRQVVTFFPSLSLQSFCYHISLGILQSLVRGPAFLPLVEWYKTWQNSISVKLGVRRVYSPRDWYVGQERSSRRKRERNRGTGGGGNEPQLTTRGRTNTCMPLWGHEKAETHTQSL